jgi:hypothetical protein
MLMGIAWAADAVTPVAPIGWNAIFQQAVQTAMPYLITLVGIAGAALVTLGTLVLNRLRAKLAASQAVDKDTLLKSAADQGVAKAKEMAAVQFKTLGTLMTGEQKEAIALDVVAKKSPDTTDAEAKSTVIAAVGAASGEGASGKLEVKA